MTSQQHFKHPDWDDFYAQFESRIETAGCLRDFIKSHDINQFTDGYGNTLLHRAVQHNNDTHISSLSEFLIDPNIKNAAGQTALQLADDIEADCIENLQDYHLCIDYAKASAQPHGLDALFAAIYRGDATLGDTSGVKNDGNEENEGGWTALYCAVIYDRPHLIRALHQRFPNLDYAVAYHTPALRLAAKYGHSNCVIALAECFPAINADDVVQAACEYNRSACIPKLRKCFPHLTGNELGDYYNSSPLMRAAVLSNLDCIRMLHSCFPNIDSNLQCRFGNTALIAAAQSLNSFDSISVLFECFPDIDPNKQDDQGLTALMHVTSRGLSACITLLHTCFPNIDVNICNNTGKTALMMAITTTNNNNDEKCLIVLSQLFPNIDPNIQDKEGNTAFMLATRTFNPKSAITQMLTLFPNMDPNIQNNTQDTALTLMIQSQYCSVKSITHVIDKFPTIKVNIQNEQSETALTLAIEKGNASFVMFLLKRFPDIEQFSSHQTGKTALVLAIEKNRINILSTFLNFLIHL